MMPDLLPQRAPVSKGARVRDWLAASLSLAVLALFPASAAHAGSIGASAQLSSSTSDGVNYVYTLTLNNTGAAGADPIQTFWFSWQPGQDYMPTRPSNIVTPAGWTSSITAGGNGFSIEFHTLTGSAASPSAAALAPGASLSGFSFQSTTTPTQMSGFAAGQPTTPVETAVIYQGQAFDGDTATIVAQTNTTPAPIKATAQLTYSSTDGITYAYALTLNNTAATGADPIQTFWFAWVPGEDFMPTSPTNIVAPPGWTAFISGGGSGDGYAIEFSTATGTAASPSAAAVLPGASLSGFYFDSTTTPAEMNGFAADEPTTPVETAVVYQGQAFDGDTATIVVQTVPKPGVIKASAQLSHTTSDGVNFTYTLTLNNTGATGNDPIQTFWFAWQPGEDLMPTSPTNIVAPTGWTASVAGGGIGDGYSIEFSTTTGTIASPSAAAVLPGTSLSGFSFDSTTTPAEMNGFAAAEPTTPVETTVVYQGQAFEGDTATIVTQTVLETSALEVGEDIPGQASDTTFAAFGTPQIGTFGGSLRSGKTIKAAIFGANGGALLEAGAPLLGLAGSVIAKLGQPSGDAALVTLAVGKSGIKANDDVVLVTGLSTGTPAFAAQNGVANAGLPAGVTIKSFLSIDGNGADTFFLATLQGAGVTSKNSRALIAVTGGGLNLLARTGATVNGKTVSQLTTLTGSPHTLADGRWRAGDATFGVRLSFSADKSEAIYTIPATASSTADWSLLAQTGPSTIGALNGATISSFGLPGFGPKGFAVLANLAVSHGGSATSANDVALLTASNGGTPTVLVRKGDPVTNDSAGHTLTGVTVKTMTDPIVGGDAQVAFLLTAAGATAKSEPGEQLALPSIAYSSDGATWSLLANVGAAAPGGGHWAGFTSLVLPAGFQSAPIFTGRLKISAADKVTSANDQGLWMLNSSGAVQLLLQTRETVSVSSVPKNVRSFTALVPAPGSNGAAAGYDQGGNVAALAAFTDGSKALLEIQAP